MKSAICNIKELFNQKVITNTEEDFGYIEKVMLDKESGKIILIAIREPGLLGYQENVCALPWHLLEIDEKNDCLKLTLDLAHLKDLAQQAPP